MSAFTTLVENADTLENGQKSKMRINVRIRTLSKTVAGLSIAVKKIVNFYSNRDAKFELRRLVRQTRRKHALYIHHASKLV